MLARLREYRKTAHPEDLEAIDWLDDELSSGRLLDPNWSPPGWDELERPTHNGATALMWAARNEDLRTMRLLVAAGADVNARIRRDGSTPLMRAGSNGRVEAVRFLLAHGARVDPTNPDEARSISLAKKRGYTKVVRLIEGAGAPQ